MNNIKLNNLIETKHKEIIFKQINKARMILAYHTYGNGICFGGVRLLSPKAGENAVKDALRLSEAMTYKLALINSPYGGCKAVVFEPEGGKTKSFLRDVGKLISQEKGRFISAIDFGFEPDDAKVIREKTKYIFAIKDSKFGQSGVTTAHGVIEGIKVSLEYVYGSRLINGKSFAIQGLGSVGNIIADELIKKGGKVFVSDTDKEKLKRFYGKATIVNPNEILYLDVDVLIPCGPAYVINPISIPKLKCKIIAGGANCQLEDEVKNDEDLHRRGILIAPDYVINAGGVIQGIEELTGGTLKKAKAKLHLIAKNLRQIYQKAKQENRGTYGIAKEIALIKLEKNKKLK